MKTDELKNGMRHKVYGCEGVIAINPPHIVKDFDGFQDNLLVCLLCDNGRVYYSTGKGKLHWLRKTW